MITGTLTTRGIEYVPIVLFWGVGGPFFVGDESPEQPDSLKVNITGNGMCRPFAMVCSLLTRVFLSSVETRVSELINEKRGLGNTSLPRGAQRSLCAT